MSRYVLGVDVGGTFTDVVLGDEQGNMTVTKVASTPDDPRIGVTTGITEVLAARHASPSEVIRLVHGTTLATNVVLERRGSAIAFVTTEGFGDMLRLGREFRQAEERFDLFFRPPDPPVPRSRTFEVRERVDATGAVLVPLDGAAVAEVAGRVADAGVRGVAVCLLHSYANPDHERRVAAALRAALPADVFVAVSSEVWPELREYERAMTTVMSAYVAPVMADYLAGLEQRLAAAGLTCPVQVMESSGGVMTAAVAARRPISTVESGGAAGVVAAGFVGHLIGRDDVLSFDMGGTTAKTGAVRAGRPDVTHDFHVGGVGSAGGRSSGYPVKIPVVDLAEVGAGGGSIAAVDAGGALQVGPRSAGSVPGPACYGRGGTEPTVTDANLLLGYLHAGSLSGGVSLSEDRARDALERAVAKPLDLDLVDAARAVHDLANATMAGAIRVVTVQRGIDPRGFTLVAFGGAGPMHAAELAGTFGINEVVVPRAAGVGSAVGLIASDLAADRALTRLMPTAAADPAEVAAVFAALEREAAAELPADGGALVFTRSVDVRYRGQAHQLTVPAPGGPVTAESVAAIPAAFRAAYRQAYGIDLEAPTELVTFRARVVRTVERVPPAGWVAVGDREVGHRLVHFAGGAVECPVLRWAGLGAGERVAGPAIVEGADTTVVVPPGWAATPDAWGNLILVPSPG